MYKKGRFANGDGWVGLGGLGWARGLRFEGGVLWIHRRTKKKKKTVMMMVGRRDATRNVIDTRRRLSATPSSERRLDRENPSQRRSSGSSICE